MTNTSLVYTGSLVAIIAFIVLRQATFGPAIFYGEFVAEDVILLLTLVSFLMPSRFRQFLWRVITCSMSAVMALATWTMSARTVSLLQAIVCTSLFALLAAFSGVHAVRALRKLRAQREAEGGR